MKLIVITFPNNKNIKHHDSLNFLIKKESIFFNNSFEFIFCSSVKVKLSLISEKNFRFNFLLLFNSLAFADKSIPEF